MQINACIVVLSVLLPIGAFAAGDASRGARAFQQCAASQPSACLETTSSICQRFHALLGRAEELADYVE
jgi:hypothetical protein